MKLADLILEIESVADMDLERAAAVGRAYDKDPELRPVRVGGDPARIKVEGSLEELIRATGLPIRWLTVRVNTQEAFEGGQLNLYQGRGSYVAWPAADGKRTFSLVPHLVEHDVHRSWVEADDGRLNQVADLFTRLCDAIDASYGTTSLLPRARPLPPADVGLAGVGWLSCFGPAFVERWPGLNATGLPTIVLRNGGVVIRVPGQPWSLDAADTQAVIDAMGTEAIVGSWGPGTPRGVHVPSFEDHMRHSPGSMEMPWIRGEAERAAAKAAKARERTYSRARPRRIAALGEGTSRLTVERAAEWSTSFDADDWRSFGKQLFQRLGGELAGEGARPLLQEIAAAPVGVEEAVAVGSDHGPVEIRWFIDDVETIDLYLFGSDELVAAVEEAHRGWSGE